MVADRRIASHDLAVAVLALGFMGFGCGDARHVTSPSVANPANPVVVALSGTVYEHTFSGQRALPGAGVRVTLARVASPGNTRETVSDSSGHYLIRDVPLSLSQSWWVWVSDDEHQQACGPGIGDYETTGPVVDVHGIPVEAGRIGGVPPTHPRAGVYGTVFEDTAGTKTPVADAKVELWSDDELLASIRTDAEGRFGFCDAYESSFGRGSWPFWVTVTKEGYRWTGFMSVQSAAQRQMSVQLRPETTGPVR